MFDEKGLPGVNASAYAGSSRTSMGTPYSPVDSPGGGDGVMSALQGTGGSGTGGAQASLASLEEGIPLQSLLGLVYPSYDPSAGFAQQQYTHIDPTQLLVDREIGQGQSYHASPSSDGYGGILSSSTASPEPYVASNSSTPPSTESSASAGSTTKTVTSRKISTSKRLSQESSAAAARGSGGGGGVNALTQQNVNARKTSVSAGRGSGSAAGAGSVVASGSGGNVPIRQAGSKSQDLGAVSDMASGTGGGGNVGSPGGGGEDSEQVPTVCTNCQTTNTPLWRRDPEGQPLCAFLYFRSSEILTQ